MMLPKLVSPAQAHLVKKFRNVKGKLLKCNYSIYFNQLCINKTPVPKYAHVTFLDPHPLQGLVSLKLENYNKK